MLEEVVPLEGLRYLSNESEHALTAINTIISAGVWQEGNFIELSVVMLQFKGGRENKVKTH